MSFLISYPSSSSHYVNFFLDESWQIVIDHFSQTKQGMYRPPNGDTFSSVLTSDISGSESPPKESGWPQKHQDFISLLGSDGHPDQTAMVIAMVAESDLEQWSSSWSADAENVVETRVSVQVTPISPPESPLKKFYLCFCFFEYFCICVFVSLIICVFVYFCICVSIQVAPISLPESPLPVPV